jgi:hypothetical protein
MSGWFATWLAIHAALCALICVLKYKGILHVSHAYILIAILLPVFGPASLLGVAWEIRHACGCAADGAGKSDGKIRTLDRDTDNSWGVVPLEEALVMNNASMRRAIMMEILHNEPLQHIDLLKLACRSDDMEVVHYATTTIMEVQRSFDLSIQGLDRAMDQSDVSSGAPNKAEEMLRQYVMSGLLEGYPLRRIRERYDDVLSRKAAQAQCDAESRLALVLNKIYMGDFSGAEGEIGLIVKERPDLEDAWLLGLRLAAEQCDRAGFDAWIARMKRAHIRLSARGRDILRFWQERTDEPEPNPVPGETVMYP